MQEPYKYGQRGGLMKGLDPNRYCVYCFAPGHDLENCQKAGRAGLAPSEVTCAYCFLPGHGLDACEFLDQRILTHEALLTAPHTGTPPPSDDELDTTIHPEDTNTDNLISVILRLQDELVRTKAQNRAQLALLQQEHRKTSRLRRAVRRLGAHVVYLRNQLDDLSPLPPHAPQD